MYSNLGTLLIKWLKWTSFYNEDFNYDLLSMKLGIFSTNIPYESAKNLTLNIHLLPREIIPAQKSRLSELGRLAP